MKMSIILELIIVYFITYKNVPLLFFYEENEQEKVINQATLLFQLNLNYYICDLHKLSQFVE